MNYLATNLSELRNQNELTQSKMQEKLKIKRNTWSNWENSVSEPSVEEIVRIAQFFGVTIDDLLLTDLRNSKEFDEARTRYQYIPLIEVDKRLNSIEDRLAMVEKKA